MNVYKTRKRTDFTSFFNGWPSKTYALQKQLETTSNERKEPVSSIETNC